MPGTQVTDSSAPNLLTGATLNAAGTTNATTVEVVKPGRVRAMLSTPTVSSTGNSATLSVELFASDDAGNSVNVVSLGKFHTESGTDAAQSGKIYFLEVRCDKEFVTATVTAAGTAPNYSGASLVLEQPHYHRVAATDSA